MKAYLYSDMFAKAKHSLDHHTYNKQKKQTNKHHFIFQDISKDSFTDTQQKTIPG